MVAWLIFVTMFGDVLPWSSCRRGVDARGRIMVAWLIFVIMFGDLLRLSSCRRGVDAGGRNMVAWLIFVIMFDDLLRLSSCRRGSMQGAALWCPGEYLSYFRAAGYVCHHACGVTQIVCRLRD